MSSLVPISGYCLPMSLEDQERAHNAAKTMLKYHERVKIAEKVIASLDATLPARQKLLDFIIKTEEIGNRKIVKTPNSADQINMALEILANAKKLVLKPGQLEEATAQFRKGAIIIKNA
jgi:hypothetical protein